MHAYFERFGGIRDYLDGVVDEARQTGYTETTLGRRRYLPDLTSDNRQRREMAERMALNAPDPGLGGRRHQGRDAQRGEGDRRRGAALADAAAGARRTRARGGAGGAGGARGAGPPRDGRRRRAVGRRWRSRSASATAGTPRPTDRADPHRARHTGAPRAGRPWRSARALLDEAFGGDFDDDDWEHALGGMHAVAFDGGAAGRARRGRPASPAARRPARCAPGTWRRSRSHRRSPAARARRGGDGRARARHPGRVRPGRAQRHRRRRGAVPRPRLAAAGRGRRRR